MKWKNGNFIIYNTRDKKMTRMVILSGDTEKVFLIKFPIICSLFYKKWDFIQIRMESQGNRGKRLRSP